MPNSQRSFVNAVKKYCARHGIAVDVRSQGWLLVMQRGSERRFALGYDLGLNSSVTLRIANDKAATAEVLGICGVPHVAHTLFLSPKLSDYIPAAGSWEAMLSLLNANPQGLVVKPNEGTGGSAVLKVLTKPQLEFAVSAIFATNRSLSISPYLEIEDEVRVVLVDYGAIVVYSKSRPAVVGDGKRSLLALALATIPTDRLSAILPEMFEDLDQATLDGILPAGHRHALNWRHNLGLGAEPVLLEQGATRDACVRIATAAAKSVEMRFGSIDVVRVDGVWKILEINSGVMMEALNRLHADLVDATYSAALDLLFSSPSSKARVLSSFAELDSLPIDLFG